MCYVRLQSASPHGTHHLSHPHLTDLAVVVELVREVDNAVVDMVRVPFRPVQRKPLFSTENI